ncbi:Serine hydroxymethyltransferase [bioreactor metagenome]|uniref:Serine hydroxymethyltransferase n=1 Tax=bioreactor metagenome TaxID=1076179 RepID=A0A644ZY75_9ZZZZ
MDDEIRRLIRAEQQRQQDNIELIASENYASREVREVTGSILTNKYAEGYPGKRYYGGCECVDQVEELARQRLCTLFHAEHANVQPHSGSQANMAVYLSVLDFHDRVLGMDLSSGGHLTHGHKLNFSGRLYDFYSYGVDEKTEMLDYDAIRAKAHEVQPKLIVAGASAYSRFIDYQEFAKIAKEVNAYLMVDMAHVAGLVAAGLHPNPVEYADFVTTTTHKTLRGPRGGAVLCKQEFAAVLDRNVFPGIQGGPLMHVIAGKAVCFDEAAQPEFIVYQRQVLKNAQVFGEALQEQGFRLVTGGTDNHLLLVDTKSSFGKTGRLIEQLLDQVCITCNKNTIPFDQEKPMTTSGIRVGTPAMTTRGFKEKEFVQIAQWIRQVVDHCEDPERLQQIKAEVLALTSQFPVI